MFALLSFMVFISLLTWLLHHFLLSLPTVDLLADRHFVEGKTVWITGASSGIGKALAEYLIGRRDTRVVLSARNEASLKVVADSLRASGVRDVLVVPLDLIALADDMTLATAAVREVEQRFGSVDVLIHNGGMSMRGETIDTTLAVDIALMKCNYLGAVALTKAVLPGMVQRRSGSILAMSSVQGKLPIAFRSAYAASKHALQAFCHSLRYEVADAGVSVTVMCPGYVNTNLSLNAMRADGGKYGKMDSSTAGGYEAEYVAALSYAALRQRIPEVVVADLSARVALMLQAIAPAVLTQILLKRTKKERAKNANM